MDKNSAGLFSIKSSEKICSKTILYAEEQALMQPWVEMECYQLSRGSQVTQMECLDFGNHHIVRETQLATVQKQGVMPSNFCTISYCTPDQKFRFSEFNAESDATLFFMPENTEFDIYVPEGVQSTYISMNQDDFLNIARVINPAEWEQPPQQLAGLVTAQKGAIKEILNSCLEAAELNGSASPFLETDEMRSMLLKNIVQIAAFSEGATQPDCTEKRQRFFAICKRARAFVEETLAADIVPTIVDICQFLGVSERTLQYAFHAYVDMPPNAYLRLCRLNRVQAILRASAPSSVTVTEVAMRFGFFHLGRFALDYRQLFNETPSQTLSLSC
ncbi:helix-turn-helix domain-containing protein [Hydrogenovibrio kuenenii]|uniref:helix-turn-helix domain-containing protein n=1 Tax=Hydrogenovibrio kuenenii TaxID=63658 RepID=UPI00046442C5|nr:helix-turn-helix domain-containing protein [Hydrogenovibrio kuenenii]